MRLERLALKGLSSAFPGVIDLPLSDLPAGVIALVGPNGKGKTTLLEATPGLIFRQLPSRDGADPVDYAIARDSYIEEEFTVEGRGTFRARLNLDGPKRQSDAVLEAILPDGTRAPLNDGKRSTYDAVVRDRFPSFDLFINSSFAAQGRGDEFTRRKPSQRKDLFVEFLGLQAYATMAAAATEAAELAADARLRLTVHVEQLQRDTAPAFAAELDRLANELQSKGGTAELRKRELVSALDALEQRAAVAQEQLAAYAAAQQRVATLTAELASRSDDRRTVTRQQESTAAALATEITSIDATCEADVAEADKRIAGNQQIQGMADAIRADAAALRQADLELDRLRADLTERLAEQRQGDDAIRQIEKRIAALVPVDQQLTRATRDASLLGTVPCGGTGVYAACQFLQDATAAQAQIAGLEAELRPKATLAEDLSRALNLAWDVKAAVETARGRIGALEDLKRRASAHAKYETALAESTAKIAGYEEAKTKARADRLAQLEAAQARHDARQRDLAGQGTSLDLTIARLADEREAAVIAVAAAAVDHAAAVQLQGELAAARREWDQVIATLATVQSGRDELERRRQDLASKQSLLADIKKRLAGVEQEQLEWRDLAKALGKGGLPDLEIDAAGPTISATTNAILLECFGPRFSLELVTQVAKADGSGMKDLFTVEVTDNEAGGAVRDIGRLSGGEKVIVQEALMCAIALFVNERMPMPIRTLFRDETGAALDPENAIRYVNMLRKVRTLGGYHHVFFISHNPAAAALADAQIQVSDGKASIVFPPFSEAA